LQTALTTQHCDYHLTAIFRGNPDKLISEWFHSGAYDGGGGKNWSYNMCKAPHHQQQTKKPAFYRQDALPVTKPTVSEHWRKKYHIPQTWSPKLTCKSSNLVLDQ